jgi:hypothetical protein
MAEDVSVAAAILAAAFVQKGELKEADAYLLWRRLRARMQGELRREAARGTAGTGAGKGIEADAAPAESAVASGAV